ncbi:MULTISPECIES: FAD-dependent monooxygenase [unclassified Agrobacterium]|uniref:FAD-dependent monooxygenase n=1 Tax=unclassified Agrobacterium TaxID=2632611 RepID=UPI00244983C6|nr:MULTISPECIES: FAD-dependent monooxygenase [unclassified Agrobacterium]MDH0614040.1 FAD-dependent monooxygenase [Agrobacterium sp. GD03872]MDH0695665.1 FAD-dependent monooxygenase [Agrobacterium sp. GD03871]MDH1058567.1 FAD-dependent monooxygenase [Agrobacterium sp. GD03992]MDH2209491.1 FAD-dependent monooxygenase [Agrobacterium sp. GD03643]MDH2218895.1 FAD-dependent monooxygenase [Agrobacterium sp. GD03638]
MPIKSVAIVGAGIAGLTAALSFARHGIDCDIIEQAGELTEVGAGLQLSPNAARILATLGVLPDIEARWTEPVSVDLASGKSLATLLSLPMGAVARSRWGAPYGVLHRSTLQNALLQAVTRNQLCRLHLGKRIENAALDVIAATTFRDHDLIVGADGVWSAARFAVPSAPTATFSGNIAWRFTVAANDVPSAINRNAVTAYLGSGGHIVAYPLKEVGGFNIVAIALGADPGATWRAESSGRQKTMLLEQFRGFSPEIVRLLDSSENPTFWPLYQAGPGRWHNGRDTVLIGDAAHAMMPFAAQGAAMAIEDAFELAGTMAGSSAEKPLPLPQALASFEALRLPRMEKARKRASLNRFAYHARGPVRAARDFVFSTRPTEAFLKDFDWLYGYRAKG